MAIKRYSENTKPDKSLNKIETYDFSEDEVFGYEKDEEMKVAVASEFADAAVARNTVDNLTSTDTNKALSANQGKVLNDRKEDKSNKVTSFQPTPDDTHYPSEKLVGDSLKAIKGVDYTEGTLKSHEDALATLNADDSTEGSVAKTVKDAVEPIIENVSDHEERITALEGVYDIGSWADVQKIVRAGLARKYLSVGDQLVANYNGSPVVWDVIGIDHETPTDKNFTHSITILPRIVLHNAQFSAPQAFYNVGDGLGAGTHIFTFAQGNATWERQYEFETSEPIPEGGVIRATSWSDDYEISAVTTYEADRKTVVESGISVTIVTGQADTLTRAINERVRSRYGSNNYLESAIKQWMNSDAKTFEWQAQTDFDMPSSYETEGFLDLLDPELVAVLGSVDKQVSKNHHADTDGNGQFTFSDKVFLLSRVEVGLGTEGTTTGEKVYEFYDGASNADRIKLLTGDPRHWWLRSPYTSTSRLVRYVRASGGLSYSNAYDSIGFVPACVII
jgi:hypothetical protein